MAGKGREKRERKAGAEPPGRPGESPCDLESAVKAPPSGESPGIRVITLLRSRYIQLFLALVVLGSFLRLYQLGSASLWLDEASTLTFARQTLAGIWGSLTAGEFNPPLFYWMEHGMLAFGENEVVLRLVPALLGILTIPVFYLVGSEILDRNTGILAAALLAFSPFAIFYSQEARAYAPMLFFFSLAFLFFLRLLGSGGRTDALLFGAFSALAFWTHFYVAVPVAVLVVTGFALKGREILGDARKGIPLAIAVLTTLLLSLPLILPAIPLFLLRTGGGPTFGIQGLDAITQTITQVSGYSAVLAILFPVLFTAGVASLLPHDRRKALILVSLLVVPLVASVPLSFRMPMVPRYLIYLLVPLLPGIALVLRPLCTRFRSRYLVYAAVALVLLVNLPVLSSYYNALQKDDWRGLSRELGARTAPGDLVVAIPGYVRQPLDFYYRNESRGTLEFGLYTVQEVEGAILSHPGRAVFFVVTGDVQSTDPGGSVIAWLGEHTRVTWRDSNGGIYLLRYEG